jgi:response regulator RpfG family c-di-GMP phosphodiesterase
MLEILIVDDKPDHLQQAKEILTEDGYTVHLAGPELPYQRALATWKTTNIMLALVGLNLPEDDTGLKRDQVAFHLIRQFKTERRNARVAVYSVSTTEEDLQNAVQSGVDGFIPRGSGVKELRQGVGYLRYLPDYWQTAPGGKTTEHTQRVYDYCRKIIPYLGYEPGDKTDNIDLGACLTATIIHDMGHLLLSRAILDAIPYIQNAEQLEQFLRHIDRVYEHCTADPILKEKIAEIVHYHHRSFDCPHLDSEIGKCDYPPKGYRGEEIPLEARVIHVLDVFEAFLLSPLGECGRNPQAVVDWMQSEKEIKCLDKGIVDVLARIIEHGFIS